MKNPPDLILLDINMPEMNGYEVCERLKSTEKLINTPVIFLSALNETQNKVKAFQSGAVDYIARLIIAMTSAFLLLRSEALTPVGWPEACLAALTFLAGSAPFALLG